MITQSYSYPKSHTWEKKIPSAYHLPESHSNESLILDDSLKFHLLKLLSIGQNPKHTSQLSEPQLRVSPADKLKLYGELILQSPPQATAEYFT